jgi:ketosteroid isomerase-like protein
MTGGNAVRELFAGRAAALSAKPAEAVIRELADREEIRDLIATYAHRMAHGPAVADLFTDDGAYINRGIGSRPRREVRGRAALDEYYGDRTGWREHPLPMIHNHLIAVGGDEARGICSVEIRMVEDGESLVASGYYKDRFRREAGHWKFTEREVSFFHWVPLQQGWAKPPAGD